MSWSDKYRAVLLLLFLPLLTGCGFRLQGADRFNETLATMHVQTADSYTVFYRRLLIAIENGGAQLVADPRKASAQLRIELDETGQEVLTVSARNVPTEYDIYYTVRYSVWIDDQPVLPSQTLTVRQDYTYDATRVLGKQREEEVIRQALAESLVRQVSQQLASL